MATKKKAPKKGSKNFKEDQGAASRTTAAGMRRVNKPKYK